MKTIIKEKIKSNKQTNKRIGVEQTMKTDNFVITNETQLNDFELLEHIATVIKRGLISNNNTQYCYFTQFKNGIMLSFDKTKYGYKIIVWDGKAEKILERKNDIK